MLYLFKVDKWHHQKSRKYSAFNGLIVRIDHHMYYQPFYFVLDNEWK